MKAIELIAQESLSFTDQHPVPTLRPDDVLVKVKACGVTWIDRDIIKGKYLQLFGLPNVPGVSISGTLVEVGVQVKGWTVGDNIIGIAPIDTSGGWAEYIVMQPNWFVEKPKELSFEEAAGSASYGLRAFSVLHYKLRLTRGETILIMNGASASGHITLQLASHWGAKIITTGTTSQEFNYLKQIKADIVRIIDLNSENLVETVMEETGSLGVDFILENPDFAITSKYNISRRDFIKCLAVHGTWVTCNQLQLDPPDTKQLFLKDASVVFCFEPSWLLSQSQQGRYLHVLSDLAKMLSTKTIKCSIHSTVTLDKVKEVVGSEAPLVGTTVISFS
eukprot:TRINITY_DN1246_c0_g1_i1.p1 TRINITY_DN1246_c0_g1~~TRINITY_DN1246_c0_g1_i1.p1  ORF type:complete len:334 (-),score=58.29 TRINITY_DN1246_c0_g1_i1:103-1104(-)